MPVRAEYYTTAGHDSPYYDLSRVSGKSPVNSEVDSDRRLQLEDLPAGWLIQCWSGWEGWTPRDWHPRLQGWKLHLSANPQCAARTLAVTTEICIRHQVAFKFLPTLDELVDSSSKQGDRGSSGKFVTIYPDGDDQFAVLVTELVDALDGQQGPYILSDLRIGDVPLFARYGGIMAMDAPDLDDRPVASIAAAGTLTLVPDRRAPRFVIPDGVELPDILRPAYERSRERSVSRLNDFSSIRPMQFSNAGGVYKATLPEGSVRVLREARPHAGLDGRQRCAVERQIVEERVLTELAGESGVQHLVGSFTAWEHRYLELDYVEGGTLTAWVVRNIHLQEDDPGEYARRAVRIGAQLIDIVERIHAHGWALGDLHTGNILVGEDDGVTVLDLEDATRLDEPRAIGFRVFEYCATEDLSAEEADWFAVARSLMLIYVSDWEVEAVAPAFWSAATAKVRRVYGEQAADQLAAVERRYPSAARSALASGVTVGVYARPPAEQTAVDALMVGVDWSRQFGSQASYPGDPSQPGSYSHEILTSGRAGITLARQRLGHPVPDADLTALVAVAASWNPAESPGLYSGLAGLALVIGESGHQEPAVRAAHQALESSLARRRLDLFGGQAGTILAALEVGRTVGDEALLTAGLAAYERLHRCVQPDTSAWTALTRRRGYFWGLAGLALTDIAAYLATEESRLLGRAIDRLRNEVEACTTISTGELMVRDTDNNRVLPYLEWGSAGIWMLITVAERLSGQSLLSDAERAGFALGCSSEFYIYPSLDHGRAGILTTLAAGGEAYAAEAARQSRLLRESLFERDGMAFSIGDGLLRLSSDLGTGAAGVALALHSYLSGEPYLALPVARSTAQGLSRRTLPNATPSDDPAARGPGSVAPDALAAVG